MKCGWLQIIFHNDEGPVKNTLQVKLSNCINLQLSATYWSFWSGELSTIWSSEITLESGAWLQQVKKYLPFHQYSTREDIITYFCHNGYFVAFLSGSELKAIKLKIIENPLPWNWKKNYPLYLLKNQFAFLVTFYDPAMSSGRWKVT